VAVVSLMAFLRESSSTVFLPRLLIREEDTYIRIEMKRKEKKRKEKKKKM